MESKIGGLFGFSAQLCNTTVHFEKSQYYLGETIRLRVVCDNSACEKTVSALKVKVKRKMDIYGRYERHGMWMRGLRHYSDYIASHKFEGC